MSKVLLFLGEDLPIQKYTFMSGQASFDIKAVKFFSTRQWKYICSIQYAKFYVCILRPPCENSMQRMVITNL